MIKMTELYRVADIEVARFRASGGAAFPPHTHDEYVICANIAGSEKVWLNGKKNTAHAGSVVIYNPQSLQASCYESDAEDAEFVSSYISPSVLAKVGSEQGWISRAVAPEIDQGIFQAPLVYQHVIHFLQAMRAENNAAIESVLIELAAALFKTVGLVSDKNGRVLTATDLTPVTAYMQQHLHAPPGLDKLAELRGISKFQLIRSFKAAYGITPAKYHMQLRLQEARRQLRAGVNVIDVCINLGFYDQSHFINVFGKYTGITPLKFSTTQRMADLLRPE